MDEELDGLSVAHNYTRWSEIINNIVKTAGVTSQTLLKEIFDSLRIGFEMSLSITTNESLERRRLILPFGKGAARIRGGGALTDNEGVFLEGLALLCSRIEI